MNTTRAAINILGSDGSLIDITSMGVEDVTSERLEVGNYLIRGTYGLVPAPEGWGYVVNVVDSDKAIDISYEHPLLSVKVKDRGGVPADLVHSITLHILVDASPEQPLPEPPLPQDPEVTALATQVQLRKEADYIITPLQDAVDIDEASDEEVALLKEWKRYRVALSKVQTQSGWPTEVEWPVKPS